MAIMLFATGAQAQTTVKREASGNYVTVKREGGYKKTGQTLTDAKGQVHDVYVSERGKLFYFRTSKSGKQYKSYITLTK